MLVYSWGNMGLVSDARCECGNDSKSVEHLLFHCGKYNMEKLCLKEAVRLKNSDWPCDTIVFLSSAKIYNTLANFARRVLRAKKGLS